MLRTLRRIVFVGVLFLVTVQPVKKGYSKALSDGYLQEVKRLASK